MNTKKTIASLVGVLLIATVLVMAVNAAGMDRSKYADMPRMAYEFDANNTTGLYINYNDILRMPNVRIYGEEGAIYPTQSYTGADDFIYPDPVDPFDPGVIAKDSATFNPAYIDDEYAYASEQWEPEITVDGEDGDEKVFLRTFYEPGYAHPNDTKMSEYYTLDPLNSFDMGALVTETTYMLLDDNGATGHSGLPKLGGIGGVENTHFMLPVASSNVSDDLPGMNIGDMVDLAYAAAGPIVTAGTIEVEQTYEYGNRLYMDDNASFMDHEVNASSFDHDAATGLEEVTLEVSYIGNMHRDAVKTKSITMHEGDKLYFNRNNLNSLTSNPAYRWYIEVTRVYYNEPNLNECYVELKLGRRLVAGETFYVDGVRYDMPAIYVAEEGGEDKFKYITFQSPIPKCDEGLWDPGKKPDQSHVTSQWLANLLQGQNVWVLPPFNELHTMIDDIGLAKFDTGGPDWEICTEAGDIIAGEKGALVFNYTDESTEDRFDTSLAERHAYDGLDEIWNWWSIFTKPDHYTELVLPDQENTTDTYTATDDCMPDNADGNEYLITTSFIAPNSEGPERDLLSKSTVDVHDIIDRAATLNGTGSAAPTLMEGDVTSLNDCVSITDAMFIAQNVTGARMLSADQMTCADTDDDGDVDITDAMHIAQYVVDPDGSLGILFKPLWQSPADDDMSPPVKC